MGYMSHDAIVVTGWDKERVIKAHEKAKEIGLPITEIIEGQVNSYYSFLIGPDGSKEGWAESHEGEKERRTWKEWAKSEPDLWVDWAHVSYGGDEPDQATLTEGNLRD
jgi:hypothetical protein